MVKIALIPEGDESPWRSTDLVDDQKIKEGLCRTVQRGIALAPQIGHKQFPADGGLGQFTDRNLGTPQFGDRFRQERYSKTLANEVNDGLEIGDVEIGLALQIRLKARSISGRVPQPISKSTNE